MDTEARMTRRARRPGRVQLAVVVRRIDEPVDLDAWLERYLAALLQAIQTAHARRHRFERRRLGAGDSDGDG